MVATIVPFGAMIVYSSISSSSVPLDSNTPEILLARHKTSGANSSVGLRSSVSFLHTSVFPKWRALCCFRANKRSTYPTVVAAEGALLILALCVFPTSCYLRAFYRSGTSRCVTKLAPGGTS